MASVSDFRLSSHAQLRISFSTIGRDDLAQAATSQVERRGRNIRNLTANWLANTRARRITNHISLTRTRSD